MISATMITATVSGTSWALGVASLSAGMLLGEISGRITRASMSRPARSVEVRDMARPVGSFLFWFGTSLGLLVAVAVLSRHSLDRVPDRIAEFIPNFLIGGLIVIAGYALAIGISAGVGQSVLSATGVRHRGVERTLRVAILATAVCLALGEVGVNTSILGLVMAMAVAGPLLSAVLLTAFGARHVAADLASGRALRGQLRVGDRLELGELEGVISAINPVTLELEEDDGRRVHLPLHLLTESAFATSPSRSHTP